MSWSLVVLSAFYLTANADLCTWQDTTPKLYHQYGINECPPANYLLSDGSCANIKADRGDCSSYCQMRTNFGYGQEQPYLTPQCISGQTCVLDETTIQVYSWRTSTNGDFNTDSLNTGISGGYIDKDGTAPRLRLEQKLGPNDCGYFTFIPIRKESCGTYTKASLSKKHGCKHPRTTANACALQLVDHDSRGPDGVRIIRGIAAFVRQDCSTLELLPETMQDAAFTTERVQLSRQSPSWDAYKSLWRLSDHNREEMQSSLVYCDITRMPNAQECVDVMTRMLARGGELVRPGSTQTIEASNTCSITIVKSRDFDEECKVTFLEVLATVQRIYSQCVAGQGVAGSGWVRGVDGPCVARVWLG